MKIYISFDFEGLAGVTNWKETMNNAEYNLLATEQLNTFLEGFFDAHPNAEAVVCDSHAYGTNLIYRKLVGNTRLIKGFPREFYMMQNLNESFDAIIYFGYHSPVGILGNMDHTYSSSLIYDIFINDKKVSEFCINSLLAAYYNIPVKFIFTDSATKEWIYKNVSNKIQIQVSKDVISRYAAELYPYQQVLDELYKNGNNLDSFKDFYFPLSRDFTVKLLLTDTNIAYTVSIIPFVKKLDDRTVEFTADNPVDLYKKLMTVIFTGSSVKNVE